LSVQIDDYPVCKSGSDGLYQISVDESSIDGTICLLDICRNCVVESVLGIKTVEVKKLNGS